MRIIYKNTDNSIGVLIPTLEAIYMINGIPYDSLLIGETELIKPDNLTEIEWQECINTALQMIAEKDVPYQLPYKIISKEDLPESRTYRNAWEWDNTIEPDGFGGESNEFDAELLANYKRVNSDN